MRTPPAEIVDQHAALYRATLEQAAQAGKPIMAKMLAGARQSLYDRSTQVRSLAERDHVELGRSLLSSNAEVLCERFPHALATAFRQASLAKDESGVEGALPAASLHFDQLELMDSVQVHETVELARSQQSAMLAADAALNELNTYMCGILGMKAVQPTRNPLRPEIYVLALKGLLEQTQVPAPVQTDWLQHMSGVLGKELSLLYATLSRQLKSKGVTAAGYAVVRTHESTGRPLASEAERNSPISPPAPVRHGMGEHARDPNQTVLTLDRLRRLLVGELDHQKPQSGLSSFAAQFSREFESRVGMPPTSDFEATVPAAFETLKEMKQVDRMVERIGKRLQGSSGEGAAERGSLLEVRGKLGRGPNSLGPALSVEVVGLMVENIAQDARLLSPIKAVVKDLEPALLRMALIDPRFFSDKQHPARRLLQEITHRSLAYDAVDARGFKDFVEPLLRAIGPLAGMQIEGAEPFERVLEQLVQVWDERKQPRQLENAVQALLHAEQRNLLAKKIGREIAARPDVGKVPPGVLAFLYGPWAQVLAHTRMADASRSEDPGQYRELVFALVWSAQPELTRKNVEKLTRLVPKLLGKLREGLALIDYPSLKTSAFFELLMKLHQQAFKPLPTVSVLPQPDGLSPSLLDDSDLWIAPSEAKVSGFMAVTEVVAQPLLSNSLRAVAPDYEASELSMVLDKPPEVSADLSLPVGAWVEMLVNGAWVRTQLSWASPHGTLFLFTSAYGSTQSMTRRSRDKMLAADTMRIVSGQHVVDGALDAVAQTAVLNSIDVKL